MLKKTLAKNKESWFLTEEQTKKELIIHDENQYINLISDILTEGSLEEGRNGTTKVVIGSSMHFDLTNNTIPFLTSKKLAWKTCLKELLWFIKGDTSNEKLQAQNKVLSNEFKALDERFNKINGQGEVRDIGKLAVERSSSVERVINGATKKAMRCVEIAMGSPLTEKEENATKKSQINSECPSIANPNYIPY